MENEKQQPFTLGVNYWPRKKAMYWWRQFDKNEVAEEFEIIKSIGLDLIRIFLLWEDWQPAPDIVNPDALKNLEKICNIAENCDLKLDVTFFTGHMSGPNWVPKWMLQNSLSKPTDVRQVVSDGRPVNCGYSNPYTDIVALNAAELLINTVVSNFKDSPAIAMWNLGNEPDLMARPPNAQTGRLWVKNQTQLIKAIDPEHPVTCGLHVNNLIEDNGLRVDEVFTEVDIAVMHGYPMYSDWADGPLDSDFVPFLCALTTALCGKPTLMEEFGGCTEAPGNSSRTWEWQGYGRKYKQFMASEEDFSDYLEQVLFKLLEVGSSGALLWCFADYSPELYSLPPCDESHHERFFGIVRPDGSLKPHAEIVKRFSETKPTIQAATRTVSLDVCAETYYQKPLFYAKQLYENFKRNLSAS